MPHSELAWLLAQPDRLLFNSFLSRRSLERGFSVDRGGLVCFGGWSGLMCIVNTKPVPMHGCPCGLLRTGVAVAVWTGGLPLGRQGTRCLGPAARPRSAPAVRKDSGGIWEQPYISYLTAFVASLESSKGSGLGLTLEVSVASESLS